MKKPKINNKDIIVQNAGEESLVYDLNTHKCYSLNKVMTAIYNYCDGNLTAEEIAGKNNLETKVVLLGLEELGKNNLLEAKYESVFTGLSRRDAVKRIGFASLAALPIITALTAPTAAQTSSICPGSCSCRYTGPTQNFPPLLGTLCGATTATRIITRCADRTCSCYIAPLGSPDICKH